MPRISACLAGAFLAVALPFGALAQTAGAGSIAVTGEARMTAPPDMASVMLGVVTRSDSAAAALSANSDALARVLERLAAAGIEPRDLQTTGLSLNPDWDHSEGGEARIRGYVATNQVTARVRDLGSLGAVLDKAVQDGANTLNGLSFSLSDPAPLMQEARARAVADARARAEVLAEAAGVDLGRILSITEGGPSVGPFPAYRAEAMAAVPIAQGEVETVAQVTITWEIAP